MMDKVQFYRKIISEYVVSNYLNKKKKTGLRRVEK